MRVEQLGLEQGPIWYADISGSGLTCYASLCLLKKLINILKFGERGEYENMNSQRNLDGPLVQEEVLFSFTASGNQRAGTPSHQVSQH